MVCFKPVAGEAVWEAYEHEVTMHESDRNSKKESMFYAIEGDVWGFIWDKIAYMSLRQQPPSENLVGKGDPSWSECPCPFSHVGGGWVAGSGMW